jgi:hypothetical protein
MLRNATFLRSLSVASVALASLASSAEAGFWRWTYNNPSNAWFKSMTAEFDPSTNRFKWDFTSGTSTNGYWLVLSPGPNPKGHAGELAIVYLDAKALTANSTITPTLTVYNYNGLNGITSYMDGNPAVAGNQTPDRIFSSLNPGNPGTIMQLTATATSTTRRFILELDASLIQNHTPLYPNPAGDDWTGLAFGQLMGTWFHPTSGLNTAYGTDPSNPNYNYLTNFTYTSQASFDTTNLTTQWVPAPGAVALLGLAGIVGARRRR